MTTPTLSDITTPQTTAELKAEIIGLLANPPAGSGLPAFPATSWQSTSMGPYFVNVEAVVLAQLSQVIANVTKGGYRTTAGDPSLVATSGPYMGTSPAATILAAEFYNLARALPTTTVGDMVLTTAAGVGPITRAAGTVIVTTPDGLQYTNVADFTIGVGTTATTSFQANSPGSKYNISTGASLALVTAIPGVTVANPGTGMPAAWISVDGTDVESDASLLARCGNQWQSLGTGSPSGAYENWAFLASPEVRRAFVNGAPGTGTVKMRLAGDNSGVGPGAVAAVIAYITPRAPLCITLDIDTAATAALKMRATIYVPAANSAAALAAAEAALTSLIPLIPVGGEPFGATRGIANSTLVDTIENSYGAITKVVVSVSNDGGSTYVAGDDFLVTVDQVVVSPGGSNPFGLQAQAA